MNLNNLTNNGKGAIEGLVLLANRFPQYQDTMLKTASDIAGDKYQLKNFFSEDDWQSLTSKAVKAVDDELKFAILGHVSIGRLKIPAESDIDYRADKSSVEISIQRISLQLSKIQYMLDDWKEQSSLSAENIEQAVNVLNYFDEHKELSTIRS